MSDDYRYFSWRVGLALVIAGSATLFFLSMVLWWFFAIGQSWFAESGLSIIILPAVAVLILGLCFFWFWTFTFLMVLFGAEEE